ncbi:DUF4396 domain-containing protein [Piscibacillus salipiscarius]|uniref:DUF4396 domain-containing protein n=1 Tax=Piscibacillus salipiscarius TaxID=299480 RepID=A0ABW5QAT4_9BACI|nr:DUF4396 domain-containing protein [Piscibacillus salipiscarius]
MLATIAWISIIIGIISAIWILIDIIRHPQMMAIMNIVWPVNGLFFGPFAIWFYYKWGVLKSKNRDLEDHRGQGATVFMSTSHCSSGCVLGDAFGVPLVAITGLTIAGSVLFAHYLVEFILAYLFGIAFQYFAIYPMQKSKNKMKAIKQAIKADSLSLIAFEVGMFGFMALVHYVLFAQPPKPTTATYWFMMQIAMILGFLTSYPANWWLVKKGIKEAM